MSLDIELQNQLEWRRDKVQELCSKGYSQREISHMLQCGLDIVDRDLCWDCTHLKKLAIDLL
jgi:Trp operon repressor